jgi:hypothetical protein
MQEAPSSQEEKVLQVVFFVELEQQLFFILFLFVKLELFFVVFVLVQLELVKQLQQRTPPIDLH